ncbi:M42 family metallopeptidase [Mycoplasmopsis columbinasalis]|uniref:Aminopeptidase ysdC n=1 Tax=Mycoplasmopsis columbinasalis TaxID=114880 RepID=A0A449BB33_9BACT|nr:M42 family metallopeptidase [Mycoplasmopsis columbinasalis]VEU78408.1 Putative aminopeptidase ysdC [Mycoplasmopsis columbinasalis]
MSKYAKLAARMKEYMALEAISRYEEPVVEALKKNTASKNFEYSRDGLGSLIIKTKTKPNAPKIMIAAHMDEVGYLVRSIEDNGQMLVSVVGGVWTSAVIGTRAKVVSNRTGKSAYGVFGHTSIHIMKREDIMKSPTNKELFVDFGFKSKAEAEEFGIEIGDPIYMHGESLDLPNDLISGKAVDNRAGVTVIDFLANNIKDLDLPNTTYIVGTAQEEVGTRGAKTSVGLINPDVAFAIDTGAAHDTTNCPKGTPKLGAGVSLLIQDGGILTDPKLVKMLHQLAQKHNIPVYNYIAEGGGTDGCQLQYGLGGVPTITLSIPQRYLHSPIGVASLVDIQATLDLITEFVKVFDNKMLQELKG